MAGAAGSDDGETGSGRAGAQPGAEAPEAPKPKTRAKPKPAAPKAGQTGAAKPKPAKPKAKAKAPRGARAKAAAAAAERARWGWWALALVLGVTALRVGLLALDLIPPHFDEGQYWAYGQELAWGYFSKPPGVGALIRLSTELFGQGGLGLRLASPLAHGLIGWLLFATARRIWDGRTGFWAAAAYLAAPGVTVSALIVSTDPPMMAAWAAALYALVRAGEPGASKLWWAVLGLALGLGGLAKYTAVAFAIGGLGYGLFSARGRDLAGVAIAAGVAFLVLLPNILWNAENGFATVSHVAEDADPGDGYGNPGALAEFLGAQLGVIGPVIFLGILAAFWNRRQWLDDWGMRLMAWQTAGLLLPIAVLAFTTRAQPNWAAPAYLAGTVLAVRFLLEAGRRRLLLGGQLGLGALAAAAMVGLAALYGARGPELPRWGDPFKKVRIGPPFCELALGAMAEEGAEALLATDRRRLSECMVLGGLGWDRIAVWNPDLLPANHHEMVATLQPGDDRRLLLAVLNPAAAGAIAARFDEAIEVDAGRFATHGDRQYSYALWVVQGFRGYDTTY
ncbi:glycosyltransferase family 39 protein [Paralimibaculum aggregatum]|uniref:Glycosyltransferase family 39 protein n=1 Tax=Paralimibaculum aggregatum TaxID=3036245 RepID=A0ABQ6LLS3_9RHOB|nr:glycosyltransferase family 39 protein [Limibaculum sp. NKW23]GMG81366.1 glycosyltransferase family 39 protein [Limibaculum sp. NKW23]